MSIKEWLVDNKVKWSETLSRFTWPIVFIFITAILSMVTIQTDGSPDLYIESLASGLCAYALILIQVIVERFYSANKRMQTILVALTISLSLLYYIYLRQAPMEANQSGSIRTMVLFFIITVSLLTVPTLRSSLRISDTLVQLIKAIFSSLLLSLILFLGVTAVIGAFSALIYSLSYHWYSQMGVISFLLIFPINFLMRLPVYTPESLSKPNQQSTAIPPLLESIVAFVAIPLLFIFTGILIIYIVLNINTIFWRSNMMEPMLIGYSISGLVTLSLSEKSSRQVARMFRWLFPFLLLGIAIFQFFASSFKTVELGMTHGRYFVLLFSIFSIIASVLYSFSRTKQEWIPRILILLSVISILPFIDAVSVGIFSQTNEVNRIAEGMSWASGQTLQPGTQSLNENEKVQLSYSFNYLNEQDALNRFDWLPDNFNYYNTFDYVFGFDPYYYSYAHNDMNEYNPDSRQYAYIQLDESTPMVLDMSNIDAFVEVATYNNYAESFTLSTGHTLDFSATNDDFSVAVLDGDNELIHYDLSFLKETIWELNAENPSYTLDDLTFHKENDQVDLTIMVKRFEMEQGSYFSGDFFVLITIK